MTLDKAIEHGKEKREKYRGAKRVDRSCRNHGTCSFCRGDRKHKTDKKELSSKEQIDELNERIMEELDAKNVKSAEPDC